ncbi:MAG: SHOCT domain-containing protein [Rhodospirillales bacterium]|nr:SHOCT domain-containing protein [Rhodospirillales bacterium]
MRQLTPEGQQVVDDLARRYAVSTDAVTTLLESLVAGGGTMAQFSHPDLGGMGQWSRGGMTMVGDMFNHGLKAKVDGLCSELSDLIGRQPFASIPAASQSQYQGAGTGSYQGQSQGGGSSFGTTRFGDVSLYVADSGSFGTWWPGDLGVPSSTGGQNNIRYAYFPDSRRLAIDIGGRVTVYNTGDHWISGVSQQQSGDASLTFTSQLGLVRVTDLPVVSNPSDGNTAEPARAKTPASPLAARDELPAEPPPAAGMDLNRAEPAVETDIVAGAPAMDVAPKPDAPAFAAAPAEQTRLEPGKPEQAMSKSDDIFAMIERLAALRDKRILSEDEFTAKKTELLSRL